jgi:hypothetical protein
LEQLDEDVLNMLRTEYVRYSQHYSASNWILNVMELRGRFFEEAFRDLSFGSWHLLLRMYSICCICVE